MFEGKDDIDEIIDQTIEKEKRWNENYVKQKRRAYNKKYNMDGKNVYEKLFSFMNQKIR